MARERTGRGLEQTLAVMGIPVGKPRRRSGRWAFGAAAAGTAAVAIVAVAPTKARAITIEDIDNALKSVVACHARFMDANGKLTFESWQDGKKRRYRLFDFSFIDRAYDGKRIWAIMSKDRYVEISSEKPDGFGAPTTTVDDQIKIWRMGYKTPPEITRTETTLDGKPVVKLTITGQDSMRKMKVRSEIYVDPKTNLPLKGEGFRFDKGVWTVSAHGIYEYPSPMDASVFELSVPNGYAVYDYSAMAEQVKTRMHAEGPSATVNGVKVTLLGVFQESFSYGQTWVLWKGGATPPSSAKAGAVDSTGKPVHCEVMYEVDDRRRPRVGAQGHQSTPVPRSIGKTRTVQIRPLGWIDGEPFYGMRVSLKGAVGSPAKPMEVQIPVCVATATYDQKEGPVVYRASGKQVGLAKFMVTPTPVYMVHKIQQAVDPQSLRNTGALPTVQAK